MGACKVYVETHPACVGLLDPNTTLASSSSTLENNPAHTTSQYRVHHFLETTLRTHKSRVYDLAKANIVFFNASFSFRHSLRYKCYDALNDYASRTNLLVFAVSFGATTFFPHFAGPHKPNVRWITMQEVGHHTSLPVPFAIFEPRWLVYPDGLHKKKPPAWDDRKLVFFAGHLPKKKYSTVRITVYRLLQNKPYASIHGTGLHENITQSRLTYDQFVDESMSHKFCIVASGDNFATPKFAESLLFAAKGGCLPIFVPGQKGKYPFEDRFNLRNLIPYSRAGDIVDTVEKLGNMTSAQAEQMRQKIREIAYYFASYETEREQSAPSATIEEMCEGAP